MKQLDIDLLYYFLTSACLNIFALGYFVAIGLIIYQQKQIAIFFNRNVCITD